MNKLLSQLSASLPVFIQRSKVTNLTSGLISSRTLANHDCKGTGPEGRFVLNGKICYEREKFLAWLYQRSSFRASFKKDLSAGASQSNFSTLKVFRKRKVS